MQVKLVYNITVTKLIINLVSIVLHSIFSHHIHQLVVLQELSCHLFFLAVAVHEHPSPKLYINIRVKGMYVHVRTYIQNKKKKGSKAAI